MTPEDRAKIETALDLMAAAIPDTSERIGRAYVEAKALLASLSDDEDLRTVAEALSTAAVELRDLYVAGGTFFISSTALDKTEAALAIAERHFNKLPAERRFANNGG